TESEALLKATQRKPGAFYYAVLDLKTGCVVETPPSFPLVEKLLRIGYVSFLDRARTTPDQRRAAAVQALADPATPGEIRRYIALRSRFGERKDRESINAGDIAWSADGSKIALVASETMFRSRDGGRTWEELDTNMSRGPYVSRDGRYAFYQRCGDAS